jgi:hypothetical protein
VRIFSRELTNIGTLRFVDVMIGITPRNVRSACSMIVVWLLFVGS